MKRAALAIAACIAASQAAAERVSHVFELLCDRTLHYFDPGVGNQIEFTTADGRAYLWFNGEPDVITGTWEVLEPAPGQIEICYHYDPQATTPAGQTYCHAYGTWLITIQENGIRDGDPYGLQNGQIPFLLPRIPRLPPEGFEADYPDGPRGAGCAAFVS